MFDELSNSHSPRQTDGKVNVIADSASTETFAFVVANDCGKVGVETQTYVVVLQIGSTILRTEDDMDEDVGEGLRHRRDLNRAFSPQDHNGPYT